MLNKVNNINEINLSKNKNNQSNENKKENTQNNNFKQILDKEIDKLSETSIKSKTLDDIIEAYKINNNNNLKIKDELIR